MNWKPVTVNSLAVLALAVAVAGCSSDDDDTTVADSDVTDVTDVTDITDTNPVASFDESTDGDITNDPNNPLFLQLADGSNTVSGSVIDSDAADGSGDLDYVTINVPGGSQLSAINLTSYDSLSTQSFIGIQSGSVFTELPGDPDQSNLLGFTLFGPSLSDILPEMGAAAGTIGFTPPLTDGDYTFWIQETGDDIANYSFDFVVTPVTP